MAILTEGYNDGAQRDWIRALRLKKQARIGIHRVKPEDRVYIVDDTVLLYIPIGVKVYKDGKGKYFVNKKELENWDRFEDFKDMFRFGK